MQTAVSSLMSAPVVTIGPDALVGEVLTLADTCRLHHFPIVSGDRLVGIVCTCDLQDLHPTDRVMKVAWRHVVTVPPQAELVDAARLMALQGVGSIVVVEATRICGLVTREDLVQADAELEQQLAEARCSACGVRKHLRPGPAGQCLCQDCLSRARSDGELDVGGGD